MRKSHVIVTGVVILGLLFTAASAFASPKPGAAADNGKPGSTPGAKATDKAVERATEGKGKPAGKMVVYKGVVASTSAGSITLNLAGGGALTFAITANTSIQAPTLSGAAALVEPGMNAVIQATQADDGTLTALRIHVIPGKPQKMHRVGTVTAYTAGASITIQDKKGNTSTFVINADTKILPPDQAGQLAVGSQVTIIAPRDVTGGTAVARGIVIHLSEGDNGTPEATEQPEATKPPKATKTPKP